MRVKRTSGHEIEFRGIKKMVYHQSLAWGVNYGLSAYHDGTIAHALYRLLPGEARQQAGKKLLHHAISRNPYHLLVVDTVVSSADSPQALAESGKILRTSLARAKGKRGCPTDGLYVTTLRNKFFDRIAKLPVPKDAREAGGVFAFLQAEKCDRQELLQRYRKASREEGKSRSSS